MFSLGAANIPPEMYSPISATDLDPFTDLKEDPRSTFGVKDQNLQRKTGVIEVLS